MRPITPSLLGRRFRQTALALGLVGGTLPLLLAAGLAPAAAQQKGYGQTMGSSAMDSQVTNFDPGSASRTGSGSGGLNPTNPLDLINKIRKSSAMDDATPPGDAVDQALKELEAQTRGQGQPTERPAGPLVSSPRPAAPVAAP
jgi:hypothetical protein